MRINLLNLDFKLITFLATTIIIAAAIIYLKLRNLKNPYNFERENELLSEFLYDEKTIQDGYDTTNLGDFERWKRNRKSKQ